MLKHKIEKFDVRRFMGGLESSKLARYSSFCGSLYFSFRSSRRTLSALDFCYRSRCRRCLSLKRNLTSLFQPFPRFYSPQRELPLCHLRDDLSQATSPIKIYRISEF